MDFRENARLRVKLDYRTRPVRLSELKRLCDKLTACIDQVWRIDSLGGRKPELSVAKLSTGSAVVEIAPDPATHEGGADLLERFIAVTSSIINDSIDGDMDFHTLELFRQLAMPVTDTEATFFINDTMITTDFIATIDRQMRRSVHAFGRLKGRLEKINVHSKRECMVFSPLLASGVKCRFEKDLTNEVGAALERTVTVEGICHYFERSPFPYLIEIQSLVVHARDETLPKLSDMRGVAPFCTGDQAAVDFIRSVRDA